MLPNLHSWLSLTRGSSVAIYARDFGRFGARAIEEDGITHGRGTSGSTIGRALERLDHSLALELAEPTRPDHEIPTRDPDKAPDTRPSGVGNWPSDVVRTCERASERCKAVRDAGG